MVVTFGAAHLTVYRDGWHFEGCLALRGLPAGKLSPNVAPCLVFDSTSPLGQRTWWLYQINVVLGTAALTWG